MKYWEIVALQVQRCRLDVGYRNSVTRDAWRWTLERPELPCLRAKLLEGLPR